MCEKIGELKDRARVELHIYRGYDQGEAEDNRELQQSILAALEREKIGKFHRVVVVTDKKFIRTTVGWMIPFCEKKMVRENCHFYVSFRKKFNLGSFVALGTKQCFIAMPGLDPDPEVPPSTTQSGIFAEDEGIADIIRHYIVNMSGEARDEQSHHAVRCPLTRHRWERGQRKALEKLITEAFDDFSNAKPVPRRVVRPMWH